MWLRKRREQLPDPCAGNSFLRANGFEAVETAKIISVSADQAGIPHVRFNVKVSSPRTAAEETRTLSLEAFYSRYPEAIRGTS